MPSNAFTSAGSTIGISAALPATFDSAGYAALTFADIGEVTEIPEFGKTFSLVTHNPVGDRKTYKFKGSYNNGSVQLPVARVPSDAGQVIALAGVESDESLSFEVTLQDGTVLYFTAKVMSYTTNVGSVDSITMASITLEIDNDVIEVAP